jgi:GH25 family lysozyme M1 (1,4-beta-N-acetylmuramidase)
MINGVDLSFYDGGGLEPRHTLNWDAYTWGFAYIKASEGTVIDDLFARQWEEAKGKTTRGAYHFFHPSVDPKLAVEKFLLYLNDDWGELPAALDLEVTDGQSDTLARAKVWLEEFYRLTGVRAMIYSSPHFLRDVLHVSSEDSWLNEYPLWLAQWPFDNMSALARDQAISDVLAGKITLTFPTPPAPWTRVSIWQWTAKGQPEDVPGYYLGSGHKEAVDFNAYNGDRDQFLLEFGYEAGGSEGGALPEDQVTTPFEGVTRFSIRRFDSNAQVILCDTSLRFHVTNLHGGLETVAAAAVRTGAQVAVNGDAWNPFPPQWPLSLAMSDGDLYQDDQYEFRPFLGIVDASDELGFVIEHRKSMVGAFQQILSGVRYLIIDRVKQPYLDGTAIQYTEKHPRTGFFVAMDGRLGIVVVDGRSVNSAGVTLSQLADIMLEFDAVDAMDGDGGGSTALAIGGVIVNQPSENRPVVNHLLVYAEAEGETPMSNGSFSMKTISADTRLRPEPNTNQAYIGLIPANVPLSSDELFIAPVDVAPQLKGDMWLKTTYNGQTGWVAYLHAGQFICKDFKIIALPTGSPDPVEKPDITISVAETEDYLAGQLVIRPKV